MPHALANDLTSDPTVQEQQAGDSTGTASDDDWDAFIVEQRDDERRSRQAVAPTRDMEPSYFSGKSGAKEEGPPRTPRKIGYVMVVFVLGALIASAVVAGLMTTEWSLLWAAMVLFVPFVLLLSAPIWLAETTRIAQDEAARAHRQASVR